VIEDAYLYRRLALLEQQVRLLSEKVGVPCPTFGSDVGATPSGLREAKEVVDSL
jgi:hypothetical protein